MDISSVEQRSGSFLALQLRYHGVSRCIMYHDVAVYLKMRPSNHTKSDFFEASRKDRGMAVWLLHDRVETVKTQTGVRHPPRCGRHIPACNAAEAVAVNVQQEELTNAEESIEFQWPLHCHHTNQTHVLH